MDLKREDFELVDRAKGEGCRGCHFLKDTDCNRPTSEWKCGMQIFIKKETKMNDKDLNGGVEVIKYEVNEARFYTTKCPIGKISVGSYQCDKCSSNLAYDRSKQTVTCTRNMKKEMTYEYNGVTYTKEELIGQVEKDNPERELREIIHTGMGRHSTVALIHGIMALIYENKDQIQEYLNTI